MKIARLFAVITALDIRYQVRMDVLDYQQLISLLHEYG